MQELPKLLRIKITSQYLAAAFSILLLTSCISDKDVAFYYCHQEDFSSYGALYKESRDKSVSLDPKSAKQLEACDKKFKKTEKIAELNVMIANAKRDLQSCSSEKAGYDNGRFVDADEFRNAVDIKDESPLLYLLEHYNGDKLSYPDIDQFDVAEAKSCVSFYNKLKAEEENLMKKNKAEDAKMKSFATQHGYKDVFDGRGIMGAIALTQYGEMSLSEAKQYLIKKDDVAFDTTLIVEAVVDDMVVYTSRVDKSFRFALKKDAEGFYGKGSPLRGSYFAITGKATLKTNMGSIEVITLKKVK